MADENASPSHPETGASVYSAPPPEKKYSPDARRKRRRNLIILIAAVVVVVAGLLLWRYLSSYESTDDAQADVHLYPVSARVSGYVIRVNVNDNQWVNKGDVLVEIDPTDYQVALAQAQANLANAEATARSLNITVPITSVNSVEPTAVHSLRRSRMRVLRSALLKSNLPPPINRWKRHEANDVKAQDDLRRYKLARR